MWPALLYARLFLESVESCLVLLYARVFLESVESCLMRGALRLVVLVPGLGIAWDVPRLLLLLPWDAKLGMPDPGLVTLDPRVLLLLPWDIKLGMPEVAKTTENVSAFHKICYFE